MKLKIKDNIILVPTTMIRWFLFSIILVILNTSLIACQKSKTITEPETPATIVSKFGKLKVEGAQIVDQNGKQVTLRGMSLFWSQWAPKFYNEDCIKWLRDDWNCTVIRAAIAADNGGYLENPHIELQNAYQAIDACIKYGIYVIVDWHDHEAELHLPEAITFFKTIANKYGDKPNIIYEIYNEPLPVSWDDVVKPYAESVISEIRKIDPDNIIVVGTPTWSQDVDDAAKNPLIFDNIAYTLHFYAGTHRQELRNKAKIAMNMGLPLFVTEWGLTAADGAGDLDYAETELWMDFVETHKLSWCNWSIVDKDEGSAALKPGADAYGNWKSLDLTESGLYIRNAIRTRNSPIFESLSEQ